jgi:hypothetical protein
MRRGSLQLRLGPVLPHKQLEKSFQNSGIAATATEAQLLTALKDLSVRKQNILVNVVQFLRMGQDGNESAGAFMARLKGQPRVCNFSLPPGVSNYSEKMVTHQLIWGLADPVIQEQILFHNSTNQNMLGTTLVFFTLVHIPAVYNIVILYDMFVHTRTTHTLMTVSEGLYNLILDHFCFLYFGPQTNVQEILNRTKKYSTAHPPSDR